MKFLWWTLALLGLAAATGTGIYYLKDRVVETGVFQGRRWTILRRGRGQFCAEIEIPGFAGPQKLGCHDTVGQAKGEAILALTNTADAAAMQTSAQVDDGFLPDLKDRFSPDLDEPVEMRLALPDLPGE